ncbi:tripartite motif-containing protein 2-like [Amphiura filiformis]|uniref:tripartite motif-containing protein 2-like n=1 Tax=Amphiura filiformis TaxID=82378 RepID=UPI003B2171F2
MSRADSKTSVSRQLECTICKCRLRDPKDLDCSHTFCLRCLDKLVEIEPENNKEQKLDRPKKPGKPNQIVEQRKREVIICPVCKTSTRVPLGGVANLRSNHVLRNLIETMSPRKSTVFGDEFDDDVLFGPVDICSTHPEELLTCYCKQCKKSMCERCNTDHGHHKSEVIGIIDQAEHSREHLKAVIRKTTRRMSRLKIAQEEASQNEAMYHESVSSVIQKVHYTASVAVANINKQRNELVEEIEASKSAVCTSFDARREFMECFDESLQNTYEAAKVLLKDRGDYEVVAMAPELCHALNRLCKEEPAHIVSIPPAHAPTFYPNRSAAEISIGKLRTKNSAGTPNAEDSTLDVGQISISEQHRLLEAEWESSLKIKGGDRNGGPELQLTRGIGSSYKDGIIAVTDVTDDHVLVY